MGFFFWGGGGERGVIFRNICCSFASLISLLCFSDNVQTKHWTDEIRSGSKHSPCLVGFVNLDSLARMDAAYNLLLIVVLRLDDVKTEKKTRTNLLPCLRTFD